MPDHRQEGTRTDRTRTPWTRDDWTRDDWVRLADRILVSAQRFASPGHARITPPGPEGGYGRAVDGLEGFARTFLLAGFRLAGGAGAGGTDGAWLEDLADWYAAGIAAGTDPASPERWVRLGEHGQAKVEAASLALILDLTRPWIWDRLAPAVQERVVEYLSPAVGDPTYPRINWVWFRLVVQTFLRSVGGPWSLADMTEDLATHDTFRRDGGWLSDGPARAYDHYTGWALHLYPALWARMAGAGDLAAGRRAADVAALDRFLLDAVTLVGADGSPLVQGRSLIYRFAAAAPFWAGALAGVPSLPPGLLRRAATGIVRHFAGRGAPDEQGLLTLGWHGPWPALAQSYSGPGSPYWASKGLLGIALPASHPVWTAPAEPLPVETGDVLRAVRAPGWLVAGVRRDGIVRVVNHGTDHAVESDGTGADTGAASGDSPLYARLGYSTATAPVLDDDGWARPVDQSAVLVDGQGRCTHRSGMRTLTVRVDATDAPGAGAPGGADVGVAGSAGPVHWMDLRAGGPDHGEGRPGQAAPAGHLTVFSLVRGRWEVRLVRADALAGDGAAGTVRLRIGGWPVAGEGTADSRPGSAAVTGGGLRSRVADVHLSGPAVAPGSPGAPGAVAAGADHHDDGPLGGPVRVPWLEYPAQPGRWVAALVELTGPARDTPARDTPVRDTPGPGTPGPGSAAGGGPGETGCRVTLGAAPGDGELAVHVDWPDGVRTRTFLDPRTTARSVTGGGPADPAIPPRAQRRAPA